MATDNDNVNSEAEELSLRDTLDAAFASAETGDDPPAEADDKTSAAAAAQDDRSRDDRGRFAPKAGDKPTMADPPTEAPPQGTAASVQAPAVATPAPPPGDSKAPASWRPEVREKWATVDPVVREEIHRREFELQRVLQQGAQARQFIESFERTVAPYEVFIRQEGGSPLQAMQNMFQTAADLRVGTPQRKASLVAELVTNFGINVELLDAALVGAAPPPGAAQPMHDPRFDQFLAQQQQFQQQAQQREQQEVARSLDTFAKSHEFYGDVATMMADIVELRARRGEAIDLEKIYAEACKLHDGVSTITAQRAAAAKAGQQSRNQSQAVLRAKRAAVSVKGDTTPDSGGATVPKNDSIRAHLEAAIESAGRA